MNQIGFVPVIFLIVILVLITIGGIYYYGHSLFKTSLQSQSTRNIVNSPTATGVAIPKQPPGMELFIKNNDLYSYDEQTASVKQISASNNVSDFDLDPTRKIVYLLVEDGQIRAYNLETKQEKQVTGEADGIVQNFTLSPDDQTIAYTTSLPTPITIKVDGSDNKIVPAPSDNQTGYSLFGIEKWLPDSQNLIIRGHGQLDTSNNFYEVDTNTNKVKQFDTYGKYDINSMPDIEYSPDGMHLAYITEDDIVHMANPDGSQAKAIFSSSSGIGLLWSPDSTKIAINASSRVGKPVLEVIDPTGKIIYQLENNQDGFMNIAWSKDSRFIAAEKYNVDTKTGTIVAAKLILIDLSNNTEKEITPNISYPTQENIGTIYFAPSYKIYYEVRSEVGGPTDQSLPHLWCWDFIKNTNTKISDSATLANSHNSWFQ